MLLLACSLACTQNWHCVIAATCSSTGRTQEDDVFWQTNVQQLNHWRSKLGKREQILMRKYPRSKIPCSCHSIPHPLSTPPMESWYLVPVFGFLCSYSDILENLAGLGIVVLESVNFHCSLAKLQVTHLKTVISWLSSSMGHLKKDWQQNHCHFNRV